MFADIQWWHVIILIAVVLCIVALIASLSGALGSRGKNRGDD